MVTRSRGGAGRGRTGPAHVVVPDVDGLLAHADRARPRRRSRARPASTWRTCSRPSTPGCTCSSTSRWPPPPTTPRLLAVARRRSAHRVPEPPLGHRAAHAARAARRAASWAPCTGSSGAGRGSGPVPQDRWKENDPDSGGLLLDLGAHLVDSAVQLFGPGRAGVRRAPRPHDARRRRRVPRARARRQRRGEPPAGGRGRGRPGTAHARAGRRRRVPRDQLRGGADAVRRAGRRLRGDPPARRARARGLAGARGGPAARAAGRRRARRPVPRGRAVGRRRRPAPGRPGRRRAHRPRPRRRAACPPPSDGSSSCPDPVDDRRRRPRRPGLDVRMDSVRRADRCRDRARLDAGFRPVDVAGSDGWLAVALDGSDRRLELHVVPGRRRRRAVRPGRPAARGAARAPRRRSSTSSSCRPGRLGLVVEHVARAVARADPGGAGAADRRRGRHGGHPGRRCARGAARRGPGRTAP